MTARNLLTLPEQWKDADSNSPPSLWDGEVYHLIYTAGTDDPSDRSHVLTFTGTVKDGDFIDFDIYGNNTSYADVKVEINNSVVKELTGSDSYRSERLSAGDTVKLTIGSTSSGYDSDYFVQPTYPINVLTNPRNVGQDAEGGSGSRPDAWNSFLGVYEFCGNGSGNGQSHPQFNYLEVPSDAVNKSFVGFQVVNRSPNQATIKVEWDGNTVFTKTLKQNELHAFTSEVQDAAGEVVPSWKITLTASDPDNDPDVLIVPTPYGAMGTKPDFITTYNNLKVTFTDSTNYQNLNSSQVSHAWSFGQGVVDIDTDAGSSAASPSFTYDQPGTYVVLYGVRWTTGDFSGTDSKVKVITVSDSGDGDSTKTKADFTAEGTNLKVTFTDTSVPDPATSLASWEWDFGDGTPKVTEQSPSHVYANEGTYTVKLTVTDSAGGKAIHTQNLTVTAPVLLGSDTYSLKGFVAYGSMADNDPNVVATLGELSVYSETFAKDRLLFAGTTGGEVQTTVNLSVFSSIDINGEHQDVPTDYAELLVDIGEWVYTQATAGQFNQNADNFLQQLNAEFNGGIKEATVGKMLQQGDLWLPESLTFHTAFVSDTSPDYTEQSRVKLWFSDHAFSTQYDEYLIEVIPPLEPVDDFFKTAQQIQTKLGQRSVPDLMEAVRELAGDDPYTILKSLDFFWYDPVTPDNKINTTWTFLIYGAAGNNVDAIKAHLVEYILSNSTHTRDEWAGIFPDIFTATEFILTPLWDQYAVPNQTLIEGVYSPIVSDTRARSVAHATAVGTGYTHEYVDSVLDITTTPYKSLAFLAVGGPDNRNGVNEFLKQWPDYMTVSTTSLDFDRMSPETQEWINLFYKLLKVAETMTDTSDIPVGMTRLHRTNENGIPVLYVVATYKNIQYLVVAKNWLVTQSNAIPDAPPTSAGGKPNPDQGGGGDEDSGNGGDQPSVPLALGLPDEKGKLVASGSDVWLASNSHDADIRYQVQGGTGPYTFSVVSAADENDPDVTAQLPGADDDLGYGVEPNIVHLEYNNAQHITLVVKVTDAKGKSAQVSYVLRVMRS